MVVVGLIVVLLIVAGVLVYLDARGRQGGPRGKSAREMQEEIEATLRWRQTKRYAILRWLRLVR